MEILQTEQSLQPNVNSLFDYYVVKDTNHDAVIFGDERLSYGELNFRANQLSHSIHKAYQQYYRIKNIPPNTLIAFYLPQGIEAIVTMLAIIKCGAAYLPLDINNPIERLKYILTDSQTALLITQISFRNDLLEIFEVYEDRIIILENEKDSNQISKVCSREYQALLTPHSLAYVMYTSGSTGKPKGVMIEHQSIVHLVKNTNYITILPKDRIAAIANLSFDASTFEIWGALLNGATILCKSGEILQNIGSFKQFLSHLTPTIVFLTTALFHFLAAADASIFKQFRYLLVGGDNINPKLMRTVCNCPAGRPQHLLHVYGPTENTTFSTAYEVITIDEEALTVPIGNFITGCHGYILDENLHPCSINKTGELYLGGNGLARGYLHLSSLEEDKFFCAVNPTERLYRTGDLVRLIDQNTLEFVGRVDNQVKIRGFRVELNEIENILNQHPDVEQAVVVVNGESSERKYLTAYCVIRKDHETSSNKMLAHWEKVYENLYQLQDSDEIIDDFSGWESSFTRKHIPLEEMKEWQAATIKRILELQPKNIFEIGCGSGLLLFQLLHQCKFYCGIDISEKIVNRLKRILQNAQITHVDVLQGYADKLSLVPQQMVFDTLIINSVIICFPSENYLSNVLAQAISKISCGTIFIGDVRDYRLLKTFCLAVVRFQNPELGWQDCYELADYNAANEQELLVAPEYFIKLKDRFPVISDVKILPKRGRSLHEMNRFRYDVIVCINQKREQSTVVNWQQWTEQMNLETILINYTNQPVAILSYPNKRIWGEFHIEQDLKSNNADKAIFQHHMLEQKIFELEDLYALAQRHGCVLYAYISIGEKTAAATYNLIFVKSHDSFIEGDYGYTKIQSAIYSNRPVLRANTYSFDSIRSEVDKHLPNYMRPTQYIRLNQMPMTSNGKIDRKRLRNIKHSDIKYVSRCIDSIHYHIVLLWEKVFDVSPIAPDANFFELGGNSILAIQLIYYINQKFSLHLSVAWVFKYQNINEQADSIRDQNEYHGKYQPIITFNNSGNTKPFYMIHPGLIGAECYAELANLLNRNINFFGVDSYNLYNDPMVMTIKDLSNYYAKQIIAQLETNIVSLGGWSLGGLIAYEVAIELQNKGVIIDKLFLIDPDPPNHHYDILESGTQIDISKLNNAPEYILSYLKKLPQGLIDRVLNNLTHDLQLSSHHLPRQTYHGKSIIFEAENWTGGALMGQQVNLREVWSPYLLNLQTYKLPGDHFSLMDDQNIESIANIINAEILPGSMCYD